MTFIVADRFDDSIMKLRGTRVHILRESVHPNEALTGSEYDCSHNLGQGFPNFSACSCQNNSAKDRGPPSTLEVTDYVLSCVHSLSTLTCTVLDY